MMIIFDKLSDNEKKYYKHFDNFRYSGFSFLMVKKEELYIMYIPKLCLINKSPLGRKK